MTVCKSLIRSAVCVIPLLLIAGARGQSFNIDLDIMAGPPEAGAGAPSSTFGGAAGSVGFWNRVDAAGPGQPTPLASVDGVLTSVTIQAPLGSGGAGGSGYQGTTGDFRSLLNDYALVPDELRYHFQGMLPGTYWIYTYAVRPGPGPVVATEVWVPGSTTNNPRVVTGPIDGNTLTEGITHSIHELSLTSNEFEIVVRGAWPNSMVNGFQIVAVPEPASIAVVLVGLGWMRLKRRRPV